MSTRAYAALHHNFYTDAALQTRSSFRVFTLVRFSHGLHGCAQPRCDTDGESETEEKTVLRHGGGHDIGRNGVVTMQLFSGCFEAQMPKIAANIVTR